MPQSGPRSYATAVQTPAAGKRAEGPVGTAPPPQGLSASLRRDPLFPLVDRGNLMVPSPGGSGLRHSRPSQ